MSDNPFSEANNPYEAPASSLEGEAGDAEKIADSSRLLLYMKLTQPWVNLIAKLGIIGAAIWILGTIGFVGFVLVYLRAWASSDDAVAGLISAGVGIFFAAGAYLLNSYASKMRDYVKAPSLPHLEATLQSQKSFWKYLGIIAAIAVGLFLLGIALVILIVAICG